MAERYYYAEQTFEKALQLKFAGQPSKTRVDDLRKMLQQISDRLGGEVRDLIMPEHFLKKPLDRNQQRLLNQNLTYSYAERNIAQQNALLTVPIDEQEEPVIAVQDAIGEKAEVSYSTRPIHEACGSWASKRRVYCLRRGVADKLVNVCVALNDVDLICHVEDCWRHEEVQEGLLLRRIIQIARDYEEYRWDWQRVKVASMSFTAARRGLAGHMAAAAFDVRLRNRAGKKELLELGNHYPDGGAVSSLDFPYLTFDEWKTRVIFEQTMQMAGLKLLRTEDWHASHGDRGLGMDGVVRMRRALYGPVRSFDAETGKIQPFTGIDIDAPFLTDGEVEDLVDDARERVPEGKAYRYGVVELADKYRRTTAVK